MFLGNCRTCGKPISADPEESNASRGYLEGAVIPTYCEWQYGIDPRQKGMADSRRYLFKKDFSYEIVKNKNGDPCKMIVTSRGLAKVVLDNFTRYAEENGCPIPNPELYKTYKQKYSMDKRFPTLKDFLIFMDMEVDAMPSKESFNQIDDKVIEYPTDECDPDFDVHSK